MAGFQIDDEDLHIHSLRGKIFTQLENEILRGKYKTGDVLNETKLSNEIGVSRTPIREVLRQLELEGLVVSIPNKGTIVRGLTKEDIEDIYEIRVLIEGVAARRATKKITAEQLAELEEIIHFEEFYTNKNDVQHLIKLDNRFHELIYRASNSRLLLRTLSSFHHYVEMVRNESFKVGLFAHAVLDEHRAIYNAINDKNSELAEVLMVSHIKNAIVRIEGSLQ